MCNYICDIFKSCKGFENQALSIDVTKKNITKNPAQQEKKLRKIYEDCVQNSLFQESYTYKKNPRTVQGNQGIQAENKQ